MKSFSHFILEVLEKVSGTQYGSNEGGVHVDSDTGKRFYIKTYRNPEQAKAEALTGKLYQAMGIKTLNPELHEGNKIKTEWNDHLQSMRPNEFKNLKGSQADDLAKMFHGAILTKNWDIVGLSHDNIMKHSDGSLYSVDQGGSMHFRAQGGPKEYGPDIGERESLVNNNGASGDVFSHLHQNHPDAIKRSLSSLRNLDMDHVHHLFKTSGLNNWEDHHRNFVARFKNLTR